MKYLIFFIIILPFFGFSQTKRAVIDSIHSKRLCTEYPGLVAEPTILNEFSTSEYVFTGKVVEIIRREYMEPRDLDENGNPIYFEPEQHFWYVLEVSEQFKGTPKKKIKIYSRIFSTISPLLMLNKEYLIYAKMIPDEEKHFFKESQYLYIFCNGRSMHLKYAKDDIRLLRTLKRN